MGLQDDVRRQMVAIYERYEKDLPQDNECKNKGLTGISERAKFMKHLQSRHVGLMRRPQKMLNDILDDLFDAMKERERREKEDAGKENDSDDSEFEFDGTVQMMQVKETNTLNKSLQKVYNTKMSENEILKVVDDDIIVTDGMVVTDEKLAEGAQKKETKRSKERKRSRSYDKKSSTDQDLKKKKTLVSLSSESSTNASSSSPSSNISSRSSIKLSDIAGIDAIKKELIELIALPLKRPEIYLHLGIQPPR